MVGVSAGIIPGGALLDGQNSQGLSMSANFLPGFTQYQTVTPQDRELPVGPHLRQLGTRQLRKCRRTARGAEDHESVGGRFAAERADAARPCTSCSSIAAAPASWSNMSAARCKIHDNVAHVLTNAPTYDWHLNNVRNYLNLSTVGVPSARDRRP